MSLYTTQVRYICESLAGDTTMTIDRIIGVAAPKMFPIGETGREDSLF